jgi:hypothetical protein
MENDFVVLLYAMLCVATVSKKLLRRQLSLSPK